MEKWSGAEEICQKYPEVWKNRNVKCNTDETLPKKTLYEFLKRLIDIFGAALGLLLASWIIAIAAIAVKLEDGGPVFFSQIRVGKDGKFFKMYKLRSMVVNAAEQKKELMHKNECDGPIFKIENDPRITKVGEFIRKTSIDELPQLVNILKGDMSIVGPRPPLGHEVMQYDEYAMRRLSVKPGLTCYWQCSGRSGLDFDEWMRLDMKYIEDRGFWTDIKLIFKTVPAVFKGDGAY
ncbi:MAG: sugar transferase [bacterium]|nr:sugar transferase [bacterium]